MKRLVMFKIWSQGRHMYEVYEISPRDNAEKLGQALVIWFNMTGGNNDGSFRRFDGVVLDRVYEDEKEYKEDPIKHPVVNDYVFRYNAYTLNMLGVGWEKLLTFTEFIYREN